MSPPDVGRVGRRVIEPDREHMLLDSRVLEIRRVFGMHGAAQEHELTDGKSALGRQHRDAAAVAVREEAQAVEISRRDPIEKLHGRLGPRGLAVPAAPIEPIRRSIEVRPYPEDVLMKVAPRHPPRIRTRESSVHEKARTTRFSLTGGGGYRIEPAEARVAGGGSRGGRRGGLSDEIV